MLETMKAYGILMGRISRISQQMELAQDFVHWLDFSISDVEPSGSATRLFMLVVFFLQNVS
jgi:hypothetical protein